MKKNNMLRTMFLSLFTFLYVFVYAQTGSISGQVLDDVGQPVPFASVTVKGTSRGASADENGRYKLPGLSDGSYTIVVNAVGFTQMEKVVRVAGGEAVADFTIKRSAVDLTEAIVIGYGTARKRDLTGAVTAISSKDFNKGSITTPEQLVAGKVAGVSIISNDGQPGGGSAIRIRGGASLSVSNDPLIVIDGVPLENANGGSLSYSPNPLSLINPNDIESMNILKDASATAIYGSRASNGVIIITTKKGKGGKLNVNFSSQFTASDPYARVKVFGAEEYREMVNASGKNDYISQLGTANTDWQDQIYRTAFGTDNNINVSGGIKKLPYRLSLGYLNQGAILKTGYLERFSGALNINPRFFDDHLKVDLNLKATRTNSRYANKEAIGNSVSFDPTQPIYSGVPRFNGYTAYLDPGAATGLRGLAPKNPVAMLDLTRDIGSAKRFIGNVQLDYKLHFFPDLRLNLNLAYDGSLGWGTKIISDSLAGSDYYSYKDPVTGTMHGGSATEARQKKESKLLEFYLNYTKELEKIDSRIEFVAGYAYQDFLNTNNSFDPYTADGLVKSTYTYFIDYPQYILISYYGRLNYSYKGKYFLTGTVRRDGSSRFSPDNRWGIYPSGAFAWRLKDENFLKESNTVSDLKLRIGYGVTGQQDGLGNYDYVSYYQLSENTAQYQLGDKFYNMYRPGGYYPRRWEQTATTNIGLDFGFLNNRITGTIDAYYKKTKYLLNDASQAAGTNFVNRIVANIGDMENKGVELTLNTRPVENNNVTWDFGFNITYNENKITKLTIAPDSTYPGVIYGDIDGGTNNKVQIHSEGYQRGAFYVFQQVYDPQRGQPLENAFIDRNKDGLINDQDRYRYKGSDPSMFLGVNSSVTYKRFNAGFSMRANIGNYLYNNPFSSTGNWNTIYNKLGYLTNGSPNVLSTGFNGDQSNVYLSDYYVQNASFLRMDYINVGYDIGRIFKTASLRVNANCQNVFVITKYKGIDPENKDGVDRNFYPRPRIFTAGFSLSF